MVSHDRSIISPRIDFTWFVLPGLIAALVALGIGTLDHSSSRTVGDGLWIVGILLVDVAHVWSTLFRTYLDPLARKHHASRLMGAPVACLIVGILVHSLSPAAFWTTLAYLAIFHFIQQHVGFALIYARLGHESAADRQLTRLAVWAGTLAPVLWWHANLPRRFEWFMPGDLIVGIPSWVGPIALLAPTPIWLAFIWRRLTMARQRRLNPMVPWLVMLPAINWHLGIVVFNDDRVFTITNVFMHGVPYLALVWVTGAREQLEPIVRGWGIRQARLVALALFYVLVACLAFVEEGLWDRLLWHERPQIFGTGLLGGYELDSSLESLLVAVLTLPQATHYILDRWIWRVGPRNPALGRQLGLCQSK